MTQKTLKITQGELMLATRNISGSDGLATPMETQKYVIHRMQSAGIPLRGIQFMLELEYGELRIRREIDGWHMTWRG